MSIDLFFVSDPFKEVKVKESEMKRREKGSRMRAGKRSCEKNEMRRNM